MKKLAFSLAEVLIALVIIGIVAAITLPVLTANYREEAAKAALKKNYSILTQAFNLAYGYDYDDFRDWNHSRSSEFLGKAYDSLSKYLYISKTCGHTVGCFERTKAKNGQYATHSSEYGFSNSEPFNFILNDGTAISLDFWYNSSVIGLGVENKLLDANANLVIGVDINGSKKPNVSGIDVFAFVLTENGLVPAGYDNNSRNCNNKSVNLNYDCTAKYLQ